MGAVAIFIIGAVIVGFAIVADRGAKEKRRSVLHQLAAMLGGMPHVETSTVTAKRQGLAVSYRFADRGSGSSHEPWTDISVVIPDKYPLTLYVERAIHSSGMRLDIEIGHPQFDRDFVVEAAPADVVRQLIDVETRAFLSARSRLELRTVRQPGDARLELSVPGWQEDPQEAIALVDGVARIGARIRDAYAAADEAVQARQPVEVGAPYRGEVDQQPARAAEDARKLELAQLDAIRAYRVHQDRNANQVFLGLFVGAILFFVMLAVIASH